MDEEIHSALECCQLILKLNNKKNLSPIAMNNTGLPLKKQLYKLGKDSGVKVILHSLQYGKIFPGQLPLVFKNKSGLFIILARISDEQALIQSPFKSSPEVISIEELHSQWAGEVIELKDRSSRFDITWFIPAFLKHKQLLAEVLLFSSMLQFLALISPLFFQVVMDKVLVHGALSTLDVLVWTLVTVGVFEVVLKGLREYLFSHTANRIDIVLGSRLFTHVLGLPLGWFKHRQVGNIISRVQELDTVREFLTGSLLTLCVDMVFTMIFLAVMATMSLTLTMIVLATLPCYIFLAWRSNQPLQACIERQFQTSAINTSFLNESVGGVETIKSLAIEPGMQRRWEQQTADMVEAGFSTQTVNNLVSQVVMLLQKVTSVAVIWYGASLVISLHMTIGQLIAFNMLLTQVHQPFSRLIELWQKFIQTRIAVEKLGDMLNQPTEQAQDTLTPDVPLRGEITLSQVSFRYRPDLPLVLRDISLTIRAGESIGIVGPSGSGKSTLARLLQKLYVPDGGQLRMDGFSLESLDTGYLRSQTGVVLQENYLFNLSVRQNIAIQEPAASLERIVSAAKTAGAHEFILQLPLGYDTVLAEGGRSLSGGQRQRIAIARALLSDPRVLIFDEATSALDDESQAVIQSNMADISKGRTVIMIAHRLSTVRQCDRIITLEAGQITESGTHQQLLHLNGCYARLWKLQQNLAKE
jgi:ATP-binding cassette subfamily B protein RtxB